ncbi:MAG TPA: CHAD domain-containing protein [Pirellulales bacterium]|nr:CHAD domain-containing protein [Pirellulales bacterium]
MAQNSKWIEPASPDEPASEVARRAIKQRLLRVHESLREAIDTPHGDPEVVHQLRVSTRRAAATLDSFRALLDQERSAWIDRRLKRVRKATNDARDYDVLVGRLKSRAADDRQWEPLLDQLKSLRREAYRPLIEQCDRLEHRHFNRKLKRLVRSVAWCDDCEPEPSFGRWAVEQVRAATAPFFEAAAGPFDDFGQLHAFRILGKRLRYAMEVFVTAFERRFRDELYPLIESLQEKLGEINDHATALGRVEQWLLDWDDAKLTRPLGALLDEERQKLRDCRAGFDAWWSAERADEWRRRFEEVLAHSKFERVA